jgi:hypothetical protein
MTYEDSHSVVFSRSHFPMEFAIPLFEKRGPYFWPREDFLDLTAQQRNGSRAGWDFKNDVGKTSKTVRPGGLNTRMSIKFR